MTTPLVCCCLPDKLGGVYSIVQNIVTNSDSRRCRYRIVLTHNRSDQDTRGVGGFGEADVRRVEYDTPRENLYAALRRVRRAIGDEPGVLVANDWIELAAISYRDANKSVLSVVHGDHAYYYALANRHAHVVNAFVSYSEYVDAKLRELFRKRADDIHYLPYGVRTPLNRWTPRPGPLRVVYVGRMHRDKGIFSFPEIDRQLRDTAHDIVWTMIGDGPDRAALQQRWSPSHVSWVGTRPAAEVVELYGDSDVFVLPSAFEGLPVTLLEAGAAGVVAVTSDLPSGIPEVVENGVTGFRVAADDLTGFARAIATLNRDRTRLQQMSDAVRARVTARFDVRRAAERYQDLFERAASTRRQRPTRLPVPYGSRLDQPWIPNGAVRLIRKVAGASGQ